MNQNVFKKIELVGTSTVSIEDAVNNALKKASKTIRQMRWFEVQEIRGAINESLDSEWQVVIELGFNLED
jgi:flavin-binding protein dodecin